MKKKRRTVSGSTKRQLSFSSVSNDSLNFDGVSYSMMLISKLYVGKIANNDLAPNLGKSRNKNYQSSSKV